MKVYHVYQFLVTGLVSQLKLNGPFKVGLWAYITKADFLLPAGVSDPAEPVEGITKAQLR